MSRQEPIISIRNLSFSYPGSSTKALDNISLDIGKGEFVAIAGASGCGKSTLLRCLIGLIPHMYPGEYRGSVHVDGLEVARNPVRELAKKVGFVFQDPENQIFTFTVKREVVFALENLAYPKDEMDRRLEWAMKIMGIGHLSEASTYELSDGQKRRVAIASVLAMRPSILVLDEPTSLLDPATASELINAVSRLRKELRITVLVVEHRLELVAPMATRLVIMSNGRVPFEGEPENVLSRVESRLLGVSVPPVIGLQMLLEQHGWNFERRNLRPAEFASILNGVLR